jgi:hypothetical protein
MPVGLLGAKDDGRTGLDIPSRATIDGFQRSLPPRGGNPRGIVTVPDMIQGRNHRTGLFTEVVCHKTQERSLRAPWISGQATALSQFLRDDLLVYHGA